MAIFVILFSLWTLLEPMCVNDELCVNLYKYVTISIVSFFVTSKSAWNGADS